MEKSHKPEEARPPQWLEEVAKELREKGSESQISELDPLSTDKSKIKTPGQKPSPYQQ